jgi:hypothetical protein
MGPPYDDDIPAGPLFHYTSTDGLYGIIRKRSLWLTHIRYLNDSAEFTHAVSEAVLHLDTRLYSEQVEERLAAVLRDRLNALPPVDYFVGSFSEHGDLLSQWRSYGEEASGFSVGVRYDDLLPHLRRQGFVLRRCVYAPEVKHDLVGALLDAAIRKARATLDEDTDLVQVADEFINAFLRLAPIFKDFAFREETEWRLFTGPLAMTHPQVEFRKTKSMIVPYFNFTLSAEQEPMRLAHVIVGPNSERELACASAAAFLHKNGIDCPVLLSKIPFRSW